MLQLAEGFTVVATMSLSLADKTTTVHGSKVEEACQAGDWERGTQLAGWNT